MQSFTCLPVPHPCPPRAFAEPADSDARQTRTQGRPGRPPAPGRLRASRTGHGRSGAVGSGAGLATALVRGRFAGAPPATHEAGRHPAPIRSPKEGWGRAQAAASHGQARSGRSGGINSTEGASNFRLLPSGSGFCTGSVLVALRGLRRSAQRPEHEKMARKMVRGRKRAELLLRPAGLESSWPKLTP